MKITSVETGNSHATKTNGAGIFDFPGLDNGDYNLQASSTGFQAYRKDGIVLNIAETLREDIALAVGASTQEVVVQSNALQVQSESSEVSTLITGQQISQLATNGRNVTSLASLGTGVSGNLPSFNGVTAQGSNANLSFNGTNPNHNNWLIDGGEVYDRGSGGKLDVLPAPDVIAEFQVLASNYPPDYGINSGGTIVMQLKSGTKSLPRRPVGVCPQRRSGCRLLLQQAGKHSQPRAAAEYLRRRYRRPGHHSASLQQRQE